MERTIYDDDEPVMSNIRTYGAKESNVASGYPMRNEKMSEEEFEEALLDKDGKNQNRANRLGDTPLLSGHDNYLNGYLIQFDLAFTLKARPEFQRYHFVDFVSSMSTMHRLMQMDLRKQFNGYIDDVILERLIEIQQQCRDNPTRENKLLLLYNCPTSLRLPARITTNYRQLKTIYNQRRHHLLPDWQKFCDEVERLPYSWLITGHLPDKTKNVEV